VISSSPAIIRRIVDLPHPGGQHAVRDEQLPVLDAQPYVAHGVLAAGVHLADTVEHDIRHRGHLGGGTELWPLISPATHRFVQCRHPA
jgi:hypothetical protein